MTSLPRSARTSSTHFEVFINEVRSETRRSIVSCVGLLRERHRERNVTGDVVYDDCDARVADVTRNQTPETLLTGRVPELEPDCSVFKIHGL
jgi:hypothetical protein